MHTELKEQKTTCSPLNGGGSSEIALEQSVLPTYRKPVLKAIQQPPAMPEPQMQKQQKLMKAYQIIISGIKTLRLRLNICGFQMKVD